MENPDKQENNRNPDGTFKEGVSGNPAGRPKGKTMKEFAREFLMNKTDEEKTEWISKVNPVDVWKMAEGMPKQDMDVTTDGQPMILRLNE